MSPTVRCPIRAHLERKTGLKSTPSHHYRRHHDRDQGCSDRPNALPRVVPDDDAVDEDAAQEEDVDAPEDRTVPQSDFRIVPGFHSPAIMMSRDNGPQRWSLQRSVLRRCRCKARREQWRGALEPRACI